MPVIDVKHPLVKHKVGLLREDDISTKKFRELTNELARLLAYEATADFPLEKTTVQCWSGPASLAMEKLCGMRSSSGCMPSSPATSARSVPWPRPVAAKLP